MRIGIVVDATCDLPPEFITEHGIDVLPIHIRLEDELWRDCRDPEATLAFYRDALGTRAYDAESVPLSAEEIRSHFLENVVVDRDFAFVITVTSTRSSIYENATKASFAVLNSYKPVRQAQGVEGPFAMRVIDSRSLFCGTAVLAAEAVRRAGAGISPNELRREIEALAPFVHAYMVPRDLYFIRKRAKKKGDRSVGLLAYAFGSALDIRPIIHAHQGETAPVARFRHFDRAVEKMLETAAIEVESGLKAPSLCVSYGGPLEDLEAIPAYVALRQVCAENEVRMLTSIMSATAAINTGAGGLSVAYASHTAAEFSD
jgi:DegV family protein with EDD domain